MRHHIVEGEPGGLPYHEWRLLIWLRRRFLRIGIDGQPVGRKEGDRPDRGEQESPSKPE